MRNNYRRVAHGLLTLAVLIGISGCRRPQEREETVVETVTVDSSASIERVADSIPEGAQALMRAYPEYIRGYADNKILFTDDTSMEYDDGKKKDFVTMLDHSDIEDMFKTPYRVPATKPEYQEDAGRTRCDALFKKMYGRNAAEVRRNLEPVEWFGQVVQFTKVNGASDSLRKVAAELRQHPELKQYLKSSGTFYWRTVRGASRQSAHSYGIAFDIGVEYSDYWLWKNKNASENDRIGYANRMPRTLVDIFQRHGFIWGGAWYHFDTMHFEFRPELLN